MKPIKSFQEQIYLKSFKIFLNDKKIKDPYSFLDKYIKLRHRIIHEAFLDDSLSLKKLDELQSLIRFIGLELAIGKTFKKIHQEQLIK